MAYDERNDQQVDGWMGVSNSIADALEVLKYKAEEQRLAQVTNKYMDKKAESVNSDTLKNYIKDCSEASSAFAEYYSKVFTLCCSQMSFPDSDKLTYMAGALDEVCEFPDDIASKIDDRFSVLDETGKFNDIRDEFNDAYDIGIDYLRGLENIKQDKEVLDKYGLYDQVVINYNNSFDDERVVGIMSADNWETAFDKYVSGKDVDFGKQDDAVKPLLSEKKFNENIDKIIELTEKSRTHGYGGPNTDYLGALYLVEDMAERAERDDVKPTEVIDTIKGLTNSGGIEAQRQYLRGQLGPQTEKNSSRKVEDKDADKGVVAKGGSGKDTVKDIAPGEGSKSSQVEDKGTDKTTNPNRDDAALRAAFSDDVVDYKDEAPELDGSDGIDF